MSQTSKLVFLDISIVTAFSFNLYAHVCSVFFFKKCIGSTALPVTLALSIGYGDSAPTNRWSSYAVFIFFDWMSRNCLVWRVSSSIFPAYCSCIWLLPDLPCMEDIMLSSEWVWYIHAAYTTSSWPAAVTLCASLAVLMTCLWADTDLRANS